MHKLVSTAIAFLILVGAGFVGVAAANKEKTHIILSFQTMYGVDGPFVGEANPIRDVIGDELPWEIAKSIKGKLDTAGHLKITVRGLVFKDSMSPSGARSSPPPPQRPATRSACGRTLSRPTARRAAAPLPPARH